MLGRGRCLPFGSCLLGPGPEGTQGAGRRGIGGVKGRRFSRNLLDFLRCRRVLSGSITNPVVLLGGLVGLRVFALLVFRKGGVAEKGYALKIL